MKEKVTLYLMFIILLILEIVLINFAFPLFLNMTLHNGLNLLLALYKPGNEEKLLDITKYFSALWALLGLALSLVVVFISKFFRDKGFIKIWNFSRILAIYASVLIIFFFILGLLFSSCYYTATGCGYQITKVFAVWAIF